MSCSYSQAGTWRHDPTTATAASASDSIRYGKYDFCEDLGAVTALHPHAAALHPRSVCSVCGQPELQSCHPEEFAAQAMSEHAHALAPAKPGSPGEWAFGAGRKAITYVSHTGEETYVERAASYYASTKSMGVTPGHTAAKDLEYPTFDPTTSALRCFRCHSTGQPSLSAGFAIQPAENGIRCEACHSPGAAHVAAGGGSGTIRKIGRASCRERV